MDKQKKNVCLRVDKDDIERFNVKYPRLLQTFLRKCVVKALVSTRFFDEVFFGEDSGG